jgi:hypothetical protein
MHARQGIGMPSIGLSMPFLFENLFAPCSADGAAGEGRRGHHGGGEGFGAEAVRHGPDWNSGSGLKT